MKGKYAAHSDLLQLLNHRKAWEYPERYVIPLQDERAKWSAVQLHGVANNSDPFARGRICLHLARGFALASDTIADAQSTIKRRASEPKPNLAALEPVKKQLDADRAWNQHNHAMFKAKKAS